ncbi:MAG: hypothetical protein IID37_05535 [Planctomycetes bacterium]|nr:hypothetical protein [Planctomycetota bacterium]
MRLVQRPWYAVAAVCAVSIFAQGVVAGSPGSEPSADNQSPRFSLDGVYALASERAEWSSFQPESSIEETTTTMDYGDGGWGIDGPVFLRAADPVEAGELELKFVGRYGEPSTGDEDWRFDFVAEWGFAENWEFIFEVPVTLGDGKVQGNGDIEEFGFHTKLWDEGDWMPAFAVRNLVRIPTGYKSSGIDYQLRGLFTKTCVPCQVRWHLNPWIKAVNGHNDDEARNFMWGTALGFDYRLSDDVNFIADYQYNRGVDEGDDDDQLVEVGIDWSLSETRMLGLSGTIGVDGNDSGDDFTLGVSYIIKLGAPRMDR